MNPPTGRNYVQPARNWQRTTVRNDVQQRERGADQRKYASSLVSASTDTCFGSRASLVQIQSSRQETTGKEPGHRVALCGARPSAAFRAGCVQLTVLMASPGPRPREWGQPRSMTTSWTRTRRHSPSTLLRPTASSDTLPSSWSDRDRPSTAKVIAPPIEGSATMMDP